MGTWRHSGGHERSTCNCSQKVQVQVTLDKWGPLFPLSWFPHLLSREKKQNSSREFYTELSRVGVHCFSSGNKEQLRRLSSTKAPAACGLCHFPTQECSYLFISVLLLSAQAPEVVLWGSFHRCLLKKHWSSTDYKFLETWLALSQLA